MLCERCNERTSTVHVTRVVNGERSEVNLCESCAKQQGELEFAFIEIPFHSMLAGFLHDLPESGAQAATKTSESVPTDQAYRCPRCGLTLQAFRKTGLLGCPYCYQHFSGRLEPLLRRLHGEVQHKGRIPKRGGEALIRQGKLESLRRELHQAVEAEDFERAALIRDQIRSLPQGGESE